MKFYRRSSSSRVIAGICGGLGEYTGIDPLFWRLGFVFIPGAITVYVIMWICTTSSSN